MRHVTSPDSEIQDVFSTLCYKAGQTIKQQLIRLLTYHEMSLFILFICSIFIDLLYTFIFRHCTAACSSDLVFRVYYLYYWSLYLWCQSSGESTLFWKRKNTLRCEQSGVLKAFRRWLCVKPKSTWSRLEEKKCIVRNQICE